MPALHDEWYYSDGFANLEYDDGLANLETYMHRHFDEDFHLVSMDDDTSPPCILLEHSDDDVTSMLMSDSDFPTLSEDIWKKFDLTDFSNSCTSSEEDSSSICSVSDDNDNHKLSCSIESNNSSAAREIRHHDCMWAGSCSSEDHSDPATMPPPSSSPPLFSDIKSSPIHQQHPQQQINSSCRPVNSRSILVQQRVPTVKQTLLTNKFNIKSSTGLRTYETKLAVNKLVRERMNNNNNNNSSATLFKHGLDSEGEEQRPDTPISDFDEPSPFLHDINSDDSDEYYSDVKSEDDESDSHSRQIKRDGFFNDHSYHIVKSSTTSSIKSTIKTDNLGVQTPSDSEEEIDVVSLGEKVCLSSPSSETTLIETKATIVRSTRHPTNLPTNPSPSDKQQLQHSMALAVKQQRNPSLVPPIRIRLDQSKKRGTPSTSSNKNTTSSGNQSDSSDATVVDTTTSTPGRRGVKRGKIHRSRSGNNNNNTTTTNYDSSSTSSSPRKRSSRSGSDSEDSSGKRSLHNTMERQRRVDLRNAFESLRVLIPKLEDTEKAPKVHILKEAGLYCRSLQMGDITMSRKAIDLRRRQSALRERVSQLRRSLAASR